MLSILLLPILHYVADFELQTNEMAINKSTSWKWLSIHVGVYSLCFALIFGPTFGVITFTTHFLTDAVTSRWTTKLWFVKKWAAEWDKLNDVLERDWLRPGEFVASYTETRHRFFCVIGLDQMIHAYTLIGTVLLLDAKPWFLE